MESDEFETINSIENWLAAPLDAETQPGVPAAAVAPPLSVAQNLFHSAGPSLAATQQNGTGLPSGVSGDGIFRAPPAGFLKSFFEAASFGPIARGEGLHVSGN